MSKCGLSCEARTVAIHEAGHAIAAIALGCGVAYATIIPQDIRRIDNTVAPGTLLGRVRYKSTPRGEDGAATSLAGPIAESIYTGVSGRWLGADRDFQLAQLALLEMAGLTQPENEPILQMYAQTAEWQSRMLAACQRAQDITERHWESIKRVAAALMDHGELSGDSVAHAMIHYCAVDRDLYWGMCEGCRTRLKRQRRTRKASDPTIQQLALPLLESQVTR